MKQTPDSDTVAQLRALMLQHDLTQREVAEVAQVSVKTVEGWLASPDAASYRSMSPRHLTVILALLPKYMAAKRRRKT